MWERKSPYQKVHHITKKHEDRTLLYVDDHFNGYGKEQEVSSSYSVNQIHRSHELMFIQPSSDASLMSQEMSSKGTIPTTWILLDSHGEVRTTTHIRCNAGI